MKKISPSSHVYQLGIVLVICVAGFLVIRSYAIPDSWNYKVWYRGDNQEDLKELPLFHGGNESCQLCHEDVSLVKVVEIQGEEEFVDEFADEINNELDEQPDEEPEIEMVFEHRTLNCEACHGPLADHARGDEKIGDAVVMDKSNWQCMNCHRKLISRPADFPQFTEEVEKHRDIEEQTLCMKCHDPHDPVEQAGVDEDEVEKEFDDELI
jgi:hypothetical protein